MYYVYLIRSLKYPDKTYIGQTRDINQRLEKHNSGASVATIDFRPWRLVAYIALDSAEKAISFEKYLKVGSGHAFAKRRFW
jgi:putative endonuclease